MGGGVEGLTRSASSRAIFPKKEINRSVPPLDAIVATICDRQKNEKKRQNVDLCGLIRQLQMLIILN